MRNWIGCVLVMAFLLVAPAAGVADVSAQEPNQPTEALAEPEGKAADREEAPAPGAEVTANGRAVEADLQSPRATMRTFLEAMAQIKRGHGDVESAWQRVYATMQTPTAEAGRPPEQIEEFKERAAQDLLSVFDRLDTTAEITNLPDRARVRETGDQRFVYFPAEAHDWVWEALREFSLYPRHEIVLVRTGPEHWQFSGQTMLDAPVLAETMQPLPPQRVTGRDEPLAAHDQLVGFARRTFADLDYRRLIFLLVMIFLGLLAGKVAGSFLRRTGERLRQRQWEARGLVFADAAGPVSLALLTAGLQAGLWPIVGDTEDLRTFTLTVLTFLYLLALGWFVFNLVDVVDVTLKRAAKNANGSVQAMLLPLIRKSLRIFVVVIFTLVVARNVFGVDITAWIAGLGIAGLAVALAAQSSVQNLFGAITVFFDKPFAVGDMITFDGQTGTVEEIGFRSTKFRLFSGAVITVPNMKFIDNSVENISRREALRRTLNISITYDTPAEKIEEAVRIAREILDEPEVKAPFDLENRPPRVYFNEYNADNLNIMVVYWYMLDPEEGRDWWTYHEHLQLVNLRIFRAYEAAGIEFAFPTQTLYLAGDPNRELAVRTAEAE